MAATTTTTPGTAPAVLAPPRPSADQVMGDEKLNDQDLISACEKFVRTYQRVRGVHGEGPLPHLKVPDGPARSEAVDQLLAECDQLLDQTWDLEAVTTDGILARCRMMDAYGEGEDVFPHGAWPDTMIAALLRDVAGLPGIPSPDADLIAACAEFGALERRLQHTHNVEFVSDDAAADAAAEALAPARYAALSRICAKPATTLEGHKALAATLLLEDTPLACRVNQDDHEDDFVNSRLLHTLLRGLSARSGGMSAP